MTIKWRYFLFISLIHIAIGVMAYYLLKERFGYLLLAEIGMVISLILAYQLYQSFVRPLQFMASGTDAIQDQDFSIRFQKTGSRELDKLVNVYNQMIDNIRDERVWMEEQNYFLQQLIQASPTGILILNFDQEITDINPKAMEILDLGTKPLQKKLSEILHPLIPELLSLPLNQANTVSGVGSERFRCQSSHFIFRGFKRQFFLIEELSKELLEAEKKAYGKVIRMMAHEVNNSLGAVNSILESTENFLRDQTGEDAMMVQEALIAAIGRNQRLGQFMRNFAEVVKLPEPTLEWVSIIQLVRAVARLMEPLAAEKGIQFQYQLLENESLKAKIDARQLEQAMINIVQNAIESIGENGIIKFLVMGDPLSITIADNGPGIDPEEQEQLFTPFFSSKPDGQGIGLTLVRDIVAKHQGKVHLETQADGWTYCRITLGRK